MNERFAAALRQAHPDPREWVSPEGYSLRQGFAISKLKRIGVWEKMPPALKHKAKEARGAWTGCLKLMPYSFRVICRSGLSEPAESEDSDTPSKRTPFGIGN
jgi:hypothetical protein